MCVWVLVRDMVGLVGIPASSNAEWVGPKGLYEDLLYCEGIEPMISAT